ncbi:MAG: UDP-3-O-(3-hydroxymyristoyl)glucosamine N-acyltransferase [Rubellimicrobium sp.]|nr:UDP-3-O-(3-hydroxymyristoyl)glucosamine N-acyltransferase [Rubellimicrobium sp.]
MREAGAGWRLDDLAAALGGTWAGDGSLRVTGAAEPAAAGPDDLAVALSPRWAAALGQGAARAALLWPDADWQGLGLRGAIFAARGRLAMAHLTQALDPGPGFAPGIHPQALVEGTVGQGVSVGAFSVIGAGAAVGAGTRIGPQVAIAAGAVVGADCLIHAGVRIGPRVHIGAGVIVQPGAVIGGDGFSFVTAGPSRAELARATLGEAVPDATGDPRWQRIHSLGGVDIGDEVEIGANACVDAGTIRATRIGRGTKIDNLSQIGHNVVIGEDCLFAAQAAIGGSAVVGNRVVAGGKCGLADNIRVGDDVVLGGGTIALSTIPAGRIMLGYPAMPMPVQVAAYKALRRLPRLLQRLGGAAQGSVPNSDGTD